MGIDRGQRAPGRGARTGEAPDANDAGAGAGGDTASDDGRIERAVRHINGLHEASSLNLALAVGRYVLDLFFGGDIEQFRFRNPWKRTHLRSLVRHPDLLLSRSTLHRYVCISGQYGLLDPQIAGALSVSAHRALLPLRDPDDLQEVAGQAVAERWTVVQISEAVRERLGPKGGGGRPPRPAARQLVDRLERALDAALMEQVVTGGLAGLGEDEALEYVERLRVSLAKIANLQDLFEERLELALAEEGWGDASVDG